MNHKCKFCGNTYECGLMVSCGLPKNAACNNCYDKGMVE